MVQTIRHEGYYSRRKTENIIRNTKEYDNYEGKEKYCKVKRNNDEKNNNH